MSSEINSNSANNSSIDDWSLFRFPPRPPAKWSDKDSEDLDLAPNWAAPPVQVESWHFSPDKKAIIHPILRKKIDLEKLTSITRLVSLVKIISEQKSDKDAISLWRALDSSAVYFFGESLPELLSSQRKILVWQDHQDD